MSEKFIGQIYMGGFNFAPRNSAFCNGQILSIAQNTALFSLLGTTYGGNGQTTFALPDLRGRIPMHSGQGPGLSPRTLGEVTGVQTVTLTANQMPAHTHTAVASTAAASDAAPGTGVVPAAVSNQTMYVTDLTGATAFTLAANATTPAGGSQPHENCMPTLTLRYCIAVEGIFPPRN
mgnify:CR=1 FL=1